MTSLNLKYIWEY